MSALAPFGVRSFRYQWSADLATSWAFEMEVLILGWFVLSATGSVQSLVTFAALAWAGSLFSPFFGLAGDRLGFRALLCTMRGLYALFATLLTVLAWTGTLQPWHVFTVAGVVGLLRPSDMVIRNVLVAQTIQPAVLMGALGISRTTSDSARIGGALAGTGGVALIGMAPAYLIVSLLYVAAFALSFGVAGGARAEASGRAEPAASVLSATAKAVLEDLKQAVRYVWHMPDQLGAFCMAFLVNLLAYPFMFNLLAYVAKDVYGAGQAELGWLAASFATGALVGSIVLSSRRLPLRAGRVMLIAGAAWFVALLAFGQVRTLEPGLALLFVSGLAQSICIVLLSAVMLRSASDEMRGRVMGLRMLAVCGLPIGLLAAGPLIEHLGFGGSTALYALLGLAATLAIGWRWRAALWSRAAPANASL